MKAAICTYLFWNRTAPTGWRPVQQGATVFWVILGAQLLAFWPSLRWYVFRTADATTGGWGLVALSLAAIYLYRSPSRIPAHIPWVGLAAPALLYAVLHGRVPPLVSAIIAVLALAWSISFLRLGRWMHPGFAGLLLLALPVIPTIQFFLGYPMRVFTAQGSAWVLRWFDIPVVREGTLLRWAGELVAIDAPCSGVHMLWTGMFLAAALTCFHDLAWLPALTVAVWATLLILLGNVIRATWLFFPETGLWPSPPGMHEGIGVVVFALVMGGLVGGFHRVTRRQECPP